MKKYLALCDTETEYVNNFISYMNRQKSIGFYYVGFSKIDELEDFICDNEVAVLIITRHLYYEGLKKDGRQILILSAICLSDNHNYIYKYQSMNDILKEISDKCDSELITLSGRNLLLGSSRLIGVYSPIHRTGKSILSVTLSAILNAKSQALYINLEGSCGFEWAYPENEQNDVSDIIYAISQDNENIVELIKEIIKDNGYFDFIPPALAPEEIRLIKYSQVIKMIELISGLNIYQNIILEFDELLDDYVDLISECDRVYMPLLDDDISIYKLRRFLRLLELKGIEVDKEKLIPIKLPRCDEDITTCEGMDRLLWSNFGVCVRELLQEDK